MTYIVGELATCFGCAISLPDAVTAFSFVALGTSLPDTFASRQAAQESPDADAAIGNVTGVVSIVWMYAINPRLKMSCHVTVVVCNGS